MARYFLPKNKVHRHGLPASDECGSRAADAAPRRMTLQKPDRGQPGIFATGPARLFLFLHHFPFSAIAGLGEGNSKLVAFPVGQTE